MEVEVVSTAVMLAETAQDPLVDLVVVLVVVVEHLAVVQAVLMDMMVEIMLAT